MVTGSEAGLGMADCCTEGSIGSEAEVCGRPISGIASLGLEPGGTAGPALDRSMTGPTRGIAFAGGAELLGSLARAGGLAVAGGAELLDSLARAGGPAVARVAELLDSSAP